MAGARKIYPRRREPQNSSEPATNPQIRVLVIAQHQLDLDDPMFAGLLQEVTGKRSRKDLTRGEASRMIDVLVQRHGFDIRRKAPAQRRRAMPRPRKSDKVIALVSGEELDKVSALGRLIEWRVKNGVDAWLKVRMGIDHVRTSDEAYRAIEGLKAMFENQMRKKHGAAWWRMEFSDPEVRFYIQEHCPAAWR